MKAVLLIILGVFIIAIAAGALRNIDAPSNTITQPQSTNIPFSPFTATFEIYTNGTKRSFTDARYHNLSSDVFLTSANPQTINIQKEGITWKDFFLTLPMEITKDCIVTGTKQTFCSSGKSKLKFFINETEDPDALDRKINPEDHLKVVYSPSS